MGYPLWAVVNSNRTYPVCTCLPDNSVYWSDLMVARSIFCTVRRPNQINIRQGTIFLALSRQRANYDNSHGAFRLFTVPGLILGLFDRPHWLSPLCYIISRDPSFKLCQTSREKLNFKNVFPKVNSKQKCSCFQDILLLLKLFCLKMLSSSWNWCKVIHLWKSTM